MSISLKGRVASLALTGLLALGSICAAPVTPAEALDGFIVIRPDDWVCENVTSDCFTLTSPDGRAVVGASYFDITDCFDLNESVDVTDFSTVMMCAALQTPGIPTGLVGDIQKAHTNDAFWYSVGIEGKDYTGEIMIVVPNDLKILIIWSRVNNDASESTMQAAKGVMDSVLLDDKEVPEMAPLCAVPTVN